jgi:hypothetical protein
MSYAVDAFEAYNSIAEAVFTPELPAGAEKFPFATVSAAT